MSRDLGVEMFVDFNQFVYGGGELELAARVAGVEIHSTPYMPNLSGSVSDGDHAFRVAEATRKLGFRMGGGLHPNVVEPQNRGFMPTIVEVAAAHQVLESYDEMAASGRAWAEIGGIVVDWYEARRARELLEWAELCDRRNREKEEAVAKVERGGEAF